MRVSCLQGWSFKRGTNDETKVIVIIEFSLAVVDLTSDRRAWEVYTIYLSHFHDHTASCCKIFFH